MALVVHMPEQNMGMDYLVGILTSNPWLAPFALVIGVLGIAILIVSKGGDS